MISILPFLSTTAPPQAPPVPGGGEAFALLMADMGGRQAVAADGTALPEPEPEAHAEAVAQPPVEPRVAAKFREPPKRAALPFEREPSDDADPEQPDEPLPPSTELTVAASIPTSPLQVPPPLTSPIAVAPVEIFAAPALPSPTDAPVPTVTALAEADHAVAPAALGVRAEPARDAPAPPSPAQAGVRPGPQPAVADNRPELAVAGPRPSPGKVEVIASREPSSAPMRDVPPAPVARDDRPAPEPVTPKPPRVEAVLPIAAPRAIASGPAAQVFAAEIRRAARETRAPAPIAMTAAPAPTEPSLRPAEPPTAPVDTSDARWPQDMVARIERLRDDADAADTSIRLLPDTLGEVEVALRREGDSVHVRFTAEEAGTRALLQEAAPRLAEAAEARGLKLGQLGVASGGSGGADPHGRPQHQPAPAPSTPARAPRPTTERDEPADTRIA